MFQELVLNFKRPAQLSETAESPIPAAAEEAKRQLEDSRVQTFQADTQTCCQPWAPESETKRL